ncbi:MAG: phage portal protein [Caulobacter sp.]|nr:phage portal protein [Caulobacter sp.]
MGELITAGAKAPARAQAFSFGDPEPALGNRGLLDYVASWSNGKWYEPPVNLSGLTRAYKAAPHHTSAIGVKRTLLTSLFEPTSLLNRKTFSAVVLDYLVLANGYLETKRSWTGKPVRLDRAIGKYTRRGVEPGRFFFLGDPTGPRGSEHEFERDSIVHIHEPDLDQEIYGIPEYLSALQSALLNESATLFRRRYYLNGSHAGFILYLNDAGMNEEDVDDLRQALKDSKGPGNFRNLFLYSPNGKKDGVQLIPVSEVAAKDEFLNIKNISRDDILAAHRVPPQLLGVVPMNAGGFGKASEAAEVFVKHEIEPLQRILLDINDQVGEEAVRFRPYEPIRTGAT